MAIVSFNATARDTTGKGAARSLRRNGQVPAVIYGHGREPQPLSLNARDLDKMLGHIQAESTVIEVSFGGTTSKTLIREIQRHPIKRQILHVDFQALVAGEKVTVSIPIVLTGIAEGVEVQDDPETSVAVVAAPRAVIEEAPAAEVVEGAPEAAAEPEVIGKGPSEEEGEGEGGTEPGKK